MSQGSYATLCVTPPGGGSERYGDKGEAAAVLRPRILQRGKTMEII